MLNLTAFDDYQKIAASFDITPDLICLIVDQLRDDGAVIDESTMMMTENAIGKFLRLGYYLHGLEGEIGEISNKFKKIQRENKCKMSDELCAVFADELGDAFWYFSQFAKILGFDLSEIARINLTKLQSRKERGKLKGSGDNR